MSWRSPCNVPKNICGFDLTRSGFILNTRCCPVHGMDPARRGNVGRLVTRAQFEISEKEDGCSTEVKSDTLLR
jgi:hypothetical protein